MRFDVEVDVDELLAALETLGDAAEPYVDHASEVTANRIALEARARVRRRTGQTQEGIVVEDSPHGGYAVVSANARMPNLPYWIERGTKYQPKRPFFDPSVELERSAHYDRIGEALQSAIREKGLAG